MKTSLAQGCGMFAGLMRSMALCCHSIGVVMTVNKSEERIQCKAATARKLGSPLPLVEISAGAVGGVWRAKRDQPIDGYFRTS